MDEIYDSIVVELMMWACEHDDACDFMCSYKFVIDALKFFDALKLSHDDIFIVLNVSGISFFIRKTSLTVTCIIFYVLWLKLLNISQNYASEHYQHCCHHKFTKN